MHSLSFDFLHLLIPGSLIFSGYLRVSGVKLSYNDAR